MLLLPLCGWCYYPANKCQSWDIMCTIRASIVASSSSRHHMAPHFSSSFNWQTLSKWFCLLYTLHVWPHVGHIHGLSPDPAPPCWWLPQPLQAFRQGCVSIILFLQLRVAVDQVVFWVHLCWQYIVIWNPAVSEMPEIMFWFSMDILNALAWIVFCSRVFSNPALTSISACSTSLAIPWMNWSLMSMLDRSWLQLTYMKL